MEVVDINRHKIIGISLCFLFFLFGCASTERNQAPSTIPNEPETTVINPPQTSQPQSSQIAESSSQLDSGNHADNKTSFLEENTGDHLQSEFTENSTEILMKQIKNGDFSSLTGADDALLSNLNFAFDSAVQSSFAP